MTSKEKHDLKIEKQVSDVFKERSKSLKSFAVPKRIPKQAHYATFAHARRN